MSLFRTLYAIFTRQRWIMKELDDLHEAVTNLQLSVQAAVSEIQSLGTKLTGLLSAETIAPADVEAVAQQIFASAKTLSDAVTPPAPPPPAA
jgi:hypothetical protein